MIYQKILISDTNIINELSIFASAIVKECYSTVITSEQNDYMIGLFQSTDSIKEHLQSGYQYYLVKDNSGEIAGYIAFYEKEDKIYLSKFYLEKNFRGKGFSKDMLEFLIEKTKEAGFSNIFLNVNKNNLIAIEVYEKLGFIRTKSEKNDIGNGFFMDDFVYEYSIENTHKQ